MSTHVAINYVIHKVGKDYEKLLKEIFTDHVGVKDTVHFMKVSWSPKDVAKGSQRYSFFATSEDYLRIAKTIMMIIILIVVLVTYLRSIYDNSLIKRKKKMILNLYLHILNNMVVSFICLLGARRMLCLQWMVMQVNKY